MGGGLFSVPALLCILMIRKLSDTPETVLIRKFEGASLSSLTRDEILAVMEELSVLKHRALKELRRKEKRQNARRVKGAYREGDRFDGVVVRPRRDRRASR